MLNGVFFLPPDGWTQRGLALVGFLLANSIMIAAENINFGLQNGKAMFV